MIEFRTINEELQGYLRDESRNVGHADKIAFPRTEEEIVSALKECFAKGIAVTIQGARTGLCAAACPDGGYIINVSRMTSVLGLKKDGDNYIAKVQPGLSLTEFRKQIRSRSFNIKDWSEEDKACFTLFARDKLYSFPPDPTESSAELGGMAACNASGSRSYRYGAMREYVEGLRLVLADGRTVYIKRGSCFAKGRKGELICEDGSRLEFTLPSYTMPATSKNTASYYVKDDMDLIDLIIGSDGTLGVISELELKLIPEDALVWGCSCMIENRNDAIAFSNKL
ncbi:MAG: FAD-binding oxidoreductase, partial [Firmicutes bacterium]|nr:FAD-binding oxidoreductase [Bacillota bacterium]